MLPLKSPRRLLPALLALALLPALVPALATAAPMDLSKLVDRPDDWFKSPDGRKILDNIVTWQNANGGWWKAYDATVPRPAKLPEITDPTNKAPANDRDSVWHRTSTFDNKATYTELRLLARGYRVTQDTKYRDAFDRGIKFVFDAQYPNGGWPQRFPIEDNYGRHITFNDNAMTDLMMLLEDIAGGDADFAWVSTDVKTRSKEAFDRGVQCILDLQIKVNGKLTGWCQQHDAKTLAPASARAYELPSIASSETAEIMRLLMRIETPDERIKTSVRSAAEWLERSKLTGIRLESKPDPSLPKGRDQVIVEDPSATEPLWARFYDIETNRPFYCGRDGVKKWSLAEIEPERRAGYAWLRPFGKQVLKEYREWAAKHGEPGAATGTGTGK
jgi:PelA/Pel-15E family pectate lyase